MSLKILYLGLPLTRNSGVVQAQINSANALKAKGHTVDQLTTYFGDKFTYHRSAGNQEELPLSNVDYSHYDVVHIHSHSWTQFLRSIKKRTQAKFVHTFHSQLQSFNPNERLPDSYADTIIFLTEFEKRRYEQEHKSNTQKIVIPNIVEASIINRSPSKSPTILYVGRFSPEKGCEELIDYQNEFGLSQGIELHMVGKSSQSAPEFENYLRSKNQDSRVKWHGWLPQQEIEAIRKKVNLQVIPSKLEAFGLAGYEALINGCPIAISDLDTLREVYQLQSDQSTPISIKTPISSRTINNAITHYFENQSSIDRRVADQTNILKDRFSGKRIGELLLNAYQK